MELQRPNFTNFDAVFCKKYIFIVNRGKAFFGGPHFNFFGGQGDLFSEATPLFQIGGSAFPERWLKPPNANANIINAQPIRNVVQHFSREVVPLPAEPPLWKSGQPDR